MIGYLKCIKTIEIHKNQSSIKNMYQNPFRAETSKVKPFREPKTNTNVKSSLIDSMFMDSIGSTGSNHKVRQISGEVKCVQKAPSLHKWYDPSNESIGIFQSNRPAEVVKPKDQKMFEYQTKIGQFSENLKHQDNMQMLLKRQQQERVELMNRQMRRMDHINSKNGHEVTRQNILRQMPSFGNPGLSMQSKPAQNAGPSLPPKVRQQPSAIPKSVPARVFGLDDIKPVVKTSKEQNARPMQECEKNHSTMDEFGRSTIGPYDATEHGDGPRPQGRVYLTESEALRQAETIGDAFENGTLKESGVIESKKDPNEEEEGVVICGVQISEGTLISDLDMYLTDQNEYIRELIARGKNAGLVGDELKSFAKQCSKFMETYNKELDEEDFDDEELDEEDFDDEELDEEELDEEDFDEEDFDDEELDDEELDDEELDDEELDDEELDEEELDDEELDEEELDDEQDEEAEDEEKVHVIHADGSMEAMTVTEAETIDDTSPKDLMAMTHTELVNLCKEKNINLSSKYQNKKALVSLLQNKN